MINETFNSTTEITINHLTVVVRIIILQIHIGAGLSVTIWIGWSIGGLAGQQASRHGPDNLDGHPGGWASKIVRVSERIDAVDCITRGRLCLLSCWILSREIRWGGKEFGPVDGLDRKSVV